MMIKLLIPSTCAATLLHYNCFQFMTRSVRNMSDLAGKTVLVTGANGGVGVELVKALVKQTAKVIALVRKVDPASPLCGLKGVKVIACDLQDVQATRQALAEVPQLDGLVNNAGVAVIKPFEELTEADFDVTFNVNIKAIFTVTQTLLPKLKDGASIVNISSLAAQRSFQGHTAYSASKAAVDSLTKSLALELGPRKIRVNSVNPTVIMTAMGRANWSDPAKANPLLNHIPLNRFCEVQETVDAIVYLLSNKSSFINAQHLVVDGGYSAS